MRRIVIAVLAGAYSVQLAAADPAQTTSGNAPPPSQPPTTFTVNPPSDTPAAPAAPPAPQKEEDSIGYVDGYSDGCASANLRYARQEHVKPNRDSKLYDSDKEYHDGWDHGYRKCEDKVSPGGLSVPGNSVVM